MSLDEAIVNTLSQSFSPRRRRYGTEIDA